MNKNLFFLAITFLFFSLLSFSANAQKTATSVINDILNMNYEPGFIGFRIQVVSPRDVKDASFVVNNPSIKSKNMNALPNSPQIKYFSDKPALSNAQSFVTGAGGSANVLLSLTQPGNLLPGVVASLGSFVYYPADRPGVEIKFNIPASLTVLDPNATRSANTLFGKTTITTKLANGQTSTVEDVIYLKIRPITPEG